MWWKLLGTVAVIAAKVFSDWAGKKAEKQIALMPKEGYEEDVSLRD